MKPLRCRVPLGRSPRAGPGAPRLRRAPGQAPSPPAFSTRGFGVKSCSAPLGAPRIPGACGTLQPPSQSPRTTWLGLSGRDTISPLWRGLRATSPPPPRSQCPLAFGSTAGLAMTSSTRNVSWGDTSLLVPVSSASPPGAGALHASVTGVHGWGDPLWLWPGWEEARDGADRREQCTRALRVTARGCWP